MLTTSEQVGSLPPQRCESTLTHVYQARIMGLFGLFSKKKKEDLDEGLSKTKETVFSRIARAVAGRTTIDDHVLE